MAEWWGLQNSFKKKKKKKKKWKAKEKRKDNTHLNAEFHIKARRDEIIFK